MGSRRSATTSPPKAGLQSGGQRAAGDGQRATSSGQRATGSGQRAAGNGRRATGNGRRATGSLEKRCGFHGVSKPRVGRRSKTHGERCASRDHRQTAQRRATSEERPATSAMPMAVFTAIPPPIAMTKCASLNAAQLRRLTVVARSAPSAVSLRTAPSTGFVNPVRDTPLFKRARRPLPAARCPLPAARRPLPAARCPLPVARCSSLVARHPLLVARRSGVPPLAETRSRSCATPCAGVSAPAPLRPLRESLLPCPTTPRTRWTAPRPETPRER
jgi:hypothetical protein